MQRTEPEPAAPDGTRQATLHPGMASLTAAADRAPSARHARAPQGRGAVPGARPASCGQARPHDRPRRSRGRRTARTGPARAALARKDAR
ncbi:DUF6380 family protein [Streptomyces sp. SudanB182_2057]|uniref:DUF6380 family protein n=1 Tax=Streptomyces sp. SudanB182_2057 TaxID=3035281 RepID=UPI003F57F7F3